MTTNATGSSPDSGRPTTGFPRTRSMQFSRTHKGIFGSQPMAALPVSTGPVSENIVSRIIEDELERFWMTGNRGVTMVGKSDLRAVVDGAPGLITARLFGKADGMLENECNGGGQPAGCLSHEGILWIPTIKGIATVDTRIDSRNVLPPPVHITRVFSKQPTMRLSPRTDSSRNWKASRDTEGRNWKSNPGKCCQKVDCVAFDKNQ